MQKVHLRPGTPCANDHERVINKNEGMAELKKKYLPSSGWTSNSGLTSFTIPHSRSEHTGNHCYLRRFSTCGLSLGFSTSNEWPGTRKILRRRERARVSSSVSFSITLKFSGADWATTTSSQYHHTCNVELNAGAQHPDIRHLIEQCWSDTRLLYNESSTFKFPSLHKSSSLHMLDVLNT
jgi:hypothetical protein